MGASALLNSELSLFWGKISLVLKLQGILLTKCRPAPTMPMKLGLNMGKRKWYKPLLVGNQDSILIMATMENTTLLVQQQVDVPWGRAFCEDNTLLCWPSFTK